MEYFANGSWSFPIQHRDLFRDLWLLARDGFEQIYYVPYCAVCDQPIQPPLPSPFVCSNCLSKLPFRMDKEKVSWEEDVPLYATFFYREPMSNMLISMKFSGRTDRARAIGPLLAMTVCRRHLSFDAVIPVPLHKKRLADRGYNQATLLAQIMSDKLSIPVVEDLLIRTVDTSRQSEAHSAVERYQHLRGAFEINESLPVLETLAGRTVLLLDDVLTTGATLAEAAKSLRAAEIKVICFVAATNKDRYSAYGDVLESW